jgi:hypothetical protein
MKILEIRLSELLFKFWFQINSTKANTFYTYKRTFDLI